MVPDCIKLLFMFPANGRIFFIKVFAESGADSELPTPSNVISNIKQGYVFMLEKSKIPSLFYSHFASLLLLLFFFFSIDINYYICVELHSFLHSKLKWCFIAETIGRDVLSSRWTKYYCVYQKETRILTMMPVNSTVKSVCIWSFIAYNHFLHRS